METFLL